MGFFRIELSTSRNALPHSSRKRLESFYLIFLLWALCFVMGGIIAGHHYSKLKSATLKQHDQSVKASTDRLEDAVNKLDAEFAENKITEAERLAGEDKALHRFALDQYNATTEFNKSYPPEWLLRMVVLLIVLPFPVVLLFSILLHIGLYIISRTEDSNLRAKGYSWLSRTDVMWLILKLRTNVSRIPRADEFLSIPGNDETVDSLVAFVQFRKAHMKSTDIASDKK